MGKMGKGVKIRKSELFDIQRRVVAYATYNSWVQAPHVSYLYEPDVTDFFDYFNKHKTELGKGSKISFNTVMLKIISEGLKASEQLNSLIDFDPKSKVGYQKVADDINIALPWLLEDGRMITPTVPDVGRKSLVEITDYINDIARRIKNTNIDQMLYKVGLSETLDDLKHFKFKVLPQIIHAKFGKHRLRRPPKAERKRHDNLPKEDKLTGDDLFNATVLVSNIGSVFKQQRGALSLLEIITPQVFVIGLNAIQDRPAVYTDENGKQQIGIRKILPLCLTFDHRALDFADLIPFQDRLDSIFTNPEEILKW
ncbi:MAG: 2-oxo acid dehydrogenase subunit E2 [Spirochaetales bacterium]|nr:2-oxo acid dehydrogenase subunit E2 [Spirochaetales bacterium]